MARVDQVPRPDWFPRIELPVAMALLAVVLTEPLYTQNRVALGIGLVAAGGSWAWLWWRTGRDRGYLRWQANVSVPVRRFLTLRPAVRRLNDEAWAERYADHQRRASLHLMVPVGLLMTAAGVGNLIAAVVG